MKQAAHTNSDTRLAPIRPEIVAAKLAAIRNYEFPELLEQITRRPRLVELMWSIQALSMQPGGLPKFCETFIDEFPEHLGTKTMIEAKGHTLTFAQKIAILNELPGCISSKIRDEACGAQSSALKDWGFLALDVSMSPEEIAELEDREKKAIEQALKKLDFQFFLSVCRKAAMEQLPGLLSSLCTHIDKGFSDGQRSGRTDNYQSYGLNDSGDGSPWYFSELISTLFEAIDRQSARVKKRIAMTEVAKLVFDALDYAIAEKVMVRIEGDSRFGKTEAMQAWCDMRPGLARLVRVPCDNSMTSFFKRIGEAMGIDCSYGSNPSRLKERIEYVIQHGGLFLVLDEGAFLIPQNYTATTPPHRLNWVRTEIVDRDLPLATAVTPQAFHAAVSRFVKKTAYTMEQYFGRNFLTHHLPDSLSEEDMIAVARIHFPELDEDALGYIASEATLSQNYLQAVEAIAKRARYRASKHGGRIALRDIQGAVSEVIPRRAAAPALEPMVIAGAGGDQVQPISDPLQGALRSLARGVQPSRHAAKSDSNLADRSLRGAGPEMREPELVSADS